MAFYVDDMTAAIKYLKDNGVKVLDEPTSYTDGPNLGLTWCYFMAPWGLQLEIVSAPNGTTSTTRPRPPAAAACLTPRVRPKR